MIKDRKRRLTIAAVVDGKMKVEDAAQVLGRSSRQVERLVAAARKAEENVAPGVASGSDVPPGKASETPSNPSLEAAKRGAGLTGDKKDSAAPTPGEVQAATADMQKTCIEGYQTIRSTVGYLMTIPLMPPLSPTDPDVAKLYETPEAVKMVLAANVERLFPIFNRVISGWAPLLAVTFGDVFALLVALRGAAVKRGWKPEPKPGDKSAARSPFEDIGRAQTPVAEKPAPQPTAAGDALREALKPGSGDVPPGTKLEAPVVPSGLFDVAA